MASNSARQPVESEPEENQTAMWLRFIVLSVVILAIVVVPLFLIQR